MITWKKIAEAMLDADYADPEGTVLELGTDDPDGRFAKIRYVQTIAEAALKVMQKGDAPAIGQRAAHYGAGRQPWDDILDAGWGPAFAAGNALKYVRRAAAKNGEDDINKARWYYHELLELAATARAQQKLLEEQTGMKLVVSSPAIEAHCRLDAMLASEERAALQEGLEVL